MRRAFNIFVLGLLLGSCKPDSFERIDVVFVSTDTVLADSLYFAKIYIQNRPSNFRIDDFYFWNEKMSRNNDTAFLSFRTTCPPDSILKLRKAKFLEKKYKIYVKGNLNDKDTMIENIRSYYIYCNNEY